MLINGYGFAWLRPKWVRSIIVCNGTSTFSPIVRGWISLQKSLTKYDTRYTHFKFVCGPNNKVIYQWVWNENFGRWLDSIMGRPSAQMCQSSATQHSKSLQKQSWGKHGSGGWSAQKCHPVKLKLSRSFVFSLLKKCFL